MSSSDARGKRIRSGYTTVECLSNLSWALQTLGELNAAEYSAAAGALNLVSTAGALIDAPTKEMRIVYKLMSIAGVLSMFLSLGETVTPSKAGDYDPKSRFSYSEIMPSSKPQSAVDTIDPQDPSPSDAKKFAGKVQARAMDDIGGSQNQIVWLRVVAQLCLKGVIFTAMRYGQLGGAITWWCRVSPFQTLFVRRSWMYFSNS